MSISNSDASEIIKALRRKSYEDATPQMLNLDDAEEVVGSFTELGYVEPKEGTG